MATRTLGRKATKKSAKAAAHGCPPKRVTVRDVMNVLVTALPAMDAHLHSILRAQRKHMANTVERIEALSTRVQKVRKEIQSLKKLLADSGVGSEEINQALIKAEDALGEADAEIEDLPAEEPTEPPVEPTDPVEPPPPSPEEGGTQPR
jgi:septal ring factor EnvC (AmiA/AmiB activator)